MNNYFLLFLSLVVLLIHNELDAQTTSNVVKGKVIYGFFEDEEKLKSTLDKMKREEPEKWAMVGAHFQKMFQIRGQFKYKLIFNRSASHFSMIEEAQEDYDDLAYKTAINVGKGNRVQFLDLNEKKRIEQIKMGFDNSIVHAVQPFNKFEWELTGNVKRIGKYNCREAIGKYYSYGGAGTPVPYEAVAWFAPELPFSFGPLGFDGLPGLILELYPIRTSKNAYRATNIDVVLNASDADLPKLSKATEVVEEEELHKRFGTLKRSITGGN